MIDTVTDALTVGARHLALLVATVATGGSLFFSEALGWIPCVLCWYQRILMYPLVVLIAVGILRRDRRLQLYILPLSLAGIGVSLYHYLLIKTDWLPPPACAVGVPCTVDYLNLFGFINIPFMALTAFVLISGLVWLASTDGRAPEAEASVAEQPSPLGLRTDALAAGMIVVGVFVAFVLAATFI